MATEQDAKRTAERLEAEHPGTNAHVVETWKRWGKGWRRTGDYGVRCHRAGELPQVFEDGDYRLVPQIDETGRRPVVNA